ncbi:50S ribosomal protein L32 [Candidatus Roizmanbacteria bacterium]|nr:50S ribosomal protein L32 [Candidatus Roizmanbacteria bacterium]
MTPLPKRKHSTQRKGKRLAQRRKALPTLVNCSACGKKKIPHRLCKHCQK